MRLTIFIKRLHNKLCIFVARRSDGPRDCSSIFGVDDVPARYRCYQICDRVLSLIKTCFFP